MPLRQTLLQCRVFRRNVAMGAQVIAKGEPLPPEAAAERHEMEMMGPVGGRRLAEPVHDVGFVGRVAVVERREQGDSWSRRFEALDACHDVDYRLRLEAGYGGAADMLDRSGKPFADRLKQ